MTRLLLLKSVLAIIYLRRWRWGGLHMSGHAWTPAEVASLINALATESTDVVAGRGISPKSIRSLLRARGVSLRRFGNQCDRSALSVAFSLAARSPRRRFSALKRSQGCRIGVAVGRSVIRPSRASPFVARSRGAGRIAQLIERGLIYRLNFCGHAPALHRLSQRGRDRRAVHRPARIEKAASGAPYAKRRH